MYAGNQKLSDRILDTLIGDEFGYTQEIQPYSELDIHPSTSYTVRAFCATTWMLANVN